ncbi:TPA: hypothetical protein ACH3X1_009175 [Trebouxia sp. C0004]
MFFKCTDNPVDKLPWSKQGEWIEANAKGYLQGCGFRKGTTLDSHGSKRWRKVLLAIWSHPTSTEVQNEDKLWETTIKHLTAPMVGYVEAVPGTARVGSLPDPWVADVGDSIPPQLQNTDNTINAHGRKLVRLCADSAMVLCTGRTLADTPAQPTFKARTNTMASCLDHVLVDPGLFSSIQYCGVGLTRPDSDHMPLEMRILLSAAAPPSPPLPPVQKHTPTWLWSGAKREQYALALQAGHARPVCNRALRLPLLGTCSKQMVASILH